MRAVVSPPSIRQRLLLRTVATVVLGAAISAAAAAVAVSTVVRAVMESALEETAQALVVLAEHEAEIEALSHGRALPAPVHVERIQWQLRRSNGRLVARSHEASDLPWPEVPLAEGHIRTRDLAVYTIPGKDLWLQVAQPLADFRQAQFKVASAAGGTVFLLGLLAAAALGWNIQHELRPLAEFAQAIDRVDPDTGSLLQPRVIRRELVPAYTALSALLQRLQAKLRSERAFAAHAAHSLRTPLAGLTAQLEVAAVNASPAIATRLSLATASAHRLSSVIDALLTMARTTEGIRWRSFDASELASVATGRQIEVDASPLFEAGTLEGDADLLAIAVSNLIDNAARHGARHAQVRAASDSTSQHIEVLDDGPGMPPDRLAQVRWALDQFESNGEIDSALGLGLTLAASVARAHNGALRLSAAEGANHGFRARLLWPDRSGGKSPVGDSGVAV
jgi:two-component system OmpR family sensor kinase